RLAAILRLDMPAAVNRSTSRILRIGNLAPGIGPLSLWKKGPTPLGFADHPTMLVHTPPRDPQVLGIARNTRSGSIGMAARDQSERVLGINRNRCSGSPGAPRIEASEMRFHAQRCLYVSESTIVVADSSVGDAAVPIA